MEPPPEEATFVKMTGEEQLLLTGMAYMKQTENLGICITTQESLEKWYEETAKRANLRGK